MGVLKQDTELSDAIRRQAIPENLRNKSLTVLSPKDLKDLPNLHLLYVNKNRYPKANIDSLTTVLQTKGALLITEAGVFRRSMINFVAAEDKTFYEVNEKALQKAGFTYMQVLPNAAIKTEEDREMLFRETRQDLKEEKIVTARQKQEIEEQKKEIAEQEQEISANAAKIDAMTEELRSGQERIDRLRGRLTGLRSDITAKEAELTLRDREIDRQTALIAEKQKAIDEQSRINARYSDEIAEKQTQIGDMNTRINRQLSQLKM